MPPVGYPFLGHRPRVGEVPAQPAAAVGGGHFDASGTRPARLDQVAVRAELRQQDEAVVQALESRPRLPHPPCVQVRPQRQPSRWRPRRPQVDLVGVLRGVQFGAALVDLDLVQQLRLRVAPNVQVELPLGCRGIGQRHPAAPLVGMDFSDVLRVEAQADRAGQLRRQRPRHRGKRLGAGPAAAERQVARLAGLSLNRAADRSVAHVQRGVEVGAMPGEGPSGVDFYLALRRPAPSVGERRDARRTAFAQVAVHVLALLGGAAARALHRETARLPDHLQTPAKIAPPAQPQVAVIDTGAGPLAGALSLHVNRLSRAQDAHHHLVVRIGPLQAPQFVVEPGDGEVLLAGDVEQIEHVADEAHPPRH